VPLAPQEQQVDQRLCFGGLITATVTVITTFGNPPHNRPIYALLALDAGVTGATGATGARGRCACSCLLC